MNRILFQAVGLMASLVISSGCAAFRQTAKPVPASASANETISTTARDEGYALLYDLVSKEKNVSKLLLIKKDSPQLKAIIQKVARNSKSLTQELDALAKQNPPLNLKFTRLPLIEQKTRDLIEKEAGKGLLHTSDQPFEFKLLQSQIEGMNYGSHLAEALLSTETNSARRDFLQRAQATLAGLRDEIYQMVLERYVR